MSIRVQFIPNKSDPPPIKTNNPQARARNKEVRIEIREIMRLIKVGQSFRVWGMETAKVTSVVYGILKEARKAGREIGVTIRPRDDYIQVWRAI